MQVGQGWDADVWDTGETHWETVNRDATETWWEAIHTGATGWTLHLKLVTIRKQKQQTENTRPRKRNPISFIVPLQVLILTKVNDILTEKENSSFSEWTIKSGFGTGR